LPWVSSQDGAGLPVRSCAVRDRFVGTLTREEGCISGHPLGNVPVTATGVAAGRSDPGWGTRDG
jgi:hypothetical protein